jgi:ankyrin repeat protein
VDVEEPAIQNIWISASDGDIDAVKRYISTGVSSNAKDEHGYTPIHAAAAYGHLELMAYLLDEAGGDVNIKDGDNDTPLHHCESVEMAQYLLSKGANISATNNDGFTPPIFALHDCDKEELVRFYMSIGVEYPPEYFEDHETPWEVDEE